MAHWNIFDQTCGVVYDSHTASLSFDPRSSATASDGTSLFKCFFSIEGGWGTFQQQGPANLPTGTIKISCLWGNVNLKSLGLVTEATSAVALVGGKNVSVKINGGVISFIDGLVNMAAGSTCDITLTSSQQDLQGDVTIHIPVSTTCDASRRLRSSYQTTSQHMRQEIQSPQCCSNEEMANGCCPPQSCGSSLKHAEPLAKSGAPHFGLHQDNLESGVQSSRESTILIVALLAFLMGLFFGDHGRAALDAVFSRTH